MTKFEKIVKLARSMTVGELVGIENDTLRNAVGELARVPPVDFRKHPFKHPDMIKAREDRQLVQCVKIYRELTGAGLADSKHAVEKHYNWY